MGVYKAAGLVGVVRGLCSESLAHPAPNKGVQATPYSLRSVRRESDLSECGNTSGYTGTR